MCPEPNSANRPDILWIKPDKEVKVIEVSVPKDARVAIAKSEKRMKYVPLMKTLKRRYKSWVDFIPVVIGATGVVTTEVKVAIERLDIGLQIETLQTIAANATASMFRDLL